MVFKSGLKTQALVIVFGVLIVGACAAMASGAIMSLSTLGDLEEHCTTKGDCDSEVVKQTGYVKNWCYFLSASFLGIGVIAAIAVVVAGVMIYYKSRAAPLAAAGAAEALAKL